MSAVKGTQTINVSGTGNTLASITTDINDTNWIERTTDVDGSYIYTIKSAAVNTLTVMDGGELTIGNPNDYSFKEKLKFLYSSNGRGYITTQTTAWLKIYGNVEIDGGSIGVSQYTFMYQINGNSEWLGNETYKPKIYNARRMHILCATAVQSTIDNSYCVIRNVQFGNCHADLFLIYFMFYNYIHKTFEFKDCEMFLDKSYLSYNGFFSTYPYCSALLDRFIIDNPKVISGSENRFIMSTSEFMGKIKNCNWDPKYATYQFQNTILANHENIKTNRFLTVEEKKIVSAKKQIIDTMYDNVTWTTSYTYIGYAYRTSVVFKNNINASAKKLYTGYCSHYYCWGSDSLYNVTPGWGTNIGETVRKVYLLDLTVKDESGNLLEDCVVKINDKNNKENWLIETNALGKLYSCYEIGGALLSNRMKEPTGETIVSDTSNNTYHTITVEKDGYKKYEFNVVMDQDREVEVTLRPHKIITELSASVNQSQISASVTQSEISATINQCS